MAEVARTEMTAKIAVDETWEGNVTTTGVSGSKLHLRVRVRVRVRFYMLVTRKMSGRTNGYGIDRSTSGDGIPIPRTGDIEWGVAWRAAEIVVDSRIGYRSKRGKDAR